VESILYTSQAINCLDFGELSRVAAIGKSLRDKRLTAVHEIEARSPPIFEHEDEDEEDYRRFAP
jgi:hypothetical protein